MSTEIFYLIPPQEMVRHAGIDPLLLQPTHEPDAEGWLRGYLELLAGRRTFEVLVSRAIEAGERAPALRLATKVQGTGAVLSEPLIHKLDELYQQLRLHCRKQMDELQGYLSDLEPDVPELTAIADDLRLQMMDLELPESRPSEVSAMEKVLGTSERLQQLKREVTTLREMAQQEARARRSRLFALARTAFDRALSFVENSRSSEGPEANLLRLLPGLVLGRRESLVEAVVQAEWPLRDAALQAELAAFAAVAAPLPTKLPARVSNPQVTRSSPVALSIMSGIVFRAVRPALFGMKNAEEFKRLATRPDRVRSDKESSVLWISIAHSTEDAVLQHGAMGYGFLHEGRSLLAQRQYRIATELFRDALQCFFEARQVVDEESFEQAACGLITTRAWPRLLATQPTRETGPQALDWLDRPQQMFAWLRDNGHAQLIASLAADLPRLAVGEAFLDIARSLFGAERELLRAYVSALLKPQRVASEPESTLERIAALLAPASPPQELTSALDSVAQELVGLDKRSVSPATRSVVLQHAERIKALLAELPRDSLAPVDEVLELLPALLTSRVEGGEARSTHHLMVQPLVQILRPRERSDEVLIPLLVKNLGDSASEDVSVQLSLATGFKSLLGKGIEFYNGGSQVELGVGSLEPGANQQVNLLVKLDENLADEHSECRFRAVLLAGREIAAKETFPVAFHPNDRRRRKSPYTMGEAVTGEHFIGRDKELKQIRDAIVGGDQDRTPLVVGIRRIGKTSILKKTMQDPEVLRHYHPVYVSVEDRPRSETTVSFFIYLCEKILEAVPKEYQQQVVFHRPELDREPYGAFERFTTSLAALPMKKRILLVMDELDWLLKLVSVSEERQARQVQPLKPQEAFQPEVLGALRKALLHCKALRMIFAGLPVLLQSNYQTRLFGLLDPVRVDRFSEAEAIKVVEYARNSFSLPPVTRDLLFRMTGLQPYLLQVVCHYLFARMIEAGRDIVTPLDVQEVIEDEILANETYFTDYLALIGQNGPVMHGLALAHRAVARTRDFVSVKEVVHQMAGLGEEVTVEQVQVQLDALCSSDRPLVRRAANNATRFQIVIGMLGECLIRRASA
ncbi:ATP-binding protein [Archangium gephyra]|uniref:hypothetical protein n=1 Tax=Archangium gephyra TaxID=48 RepID=UPI0035D44DA9